ncbi:MAG TPA: S-layer homology domain-containing protein [Chloroflexia bacterium]|nr:S-layer homology domain-containing protein [Chloroflexia bacterium]
MLRRTTLLGLILTLGLLLGLSMASGGGVAYAAGGDLDPTFSGDGKLTTDYINTSDEVRAVVVQPDGKTVVAGATLISGSNYNFAVARYNPDGSPDTTFSFDGKLTTDFLGAEDRANAVALQSDGKIVVAGFCRGQVFTSESPALARYNPDGSLDPSFDGDGRYCEDGQATIVTGAAIQNDGKIVVVGHHPQWQPDFRVARFNPNGTFDTSFGSGGWVTTNFFGGIDQAQAVAIEAGKIVVAGMAHVTGANWDFALARYNANGSLDTTFSGDGKVTTDFFGGDDGAYALALQPDGKIVAAGTFHTVSAGYDFGFVRYLANGSEDTTFDNDGLQAVTFMPGTAEEVAFGVGVQSDGKIVAAGYAPTSTYNDFALVRLNANGSLDSSFGGDGRVSTNIAGGVDLAQAMAIQPDGKIVAAGYAYTTTGADLAVARYLSGSEPAATATPTTAPTQTPGGPTATPTTCSVQYPDVPPGSTFYEYVRCLACRGIVSGYPDGNFGPGNNVTRGQLSKIVANSAGYTENHANQSFEDVPVGSTFHQYIERLASRGHISGYACGGPEEPCVPPDNRPYFRPNNAVTRGQTAKIVASAAGLPAPPPGLWTFQDVPQGSTFWEWVEELSSAGAIQGYPCGGPGEPCFPPENRYYFRPGNNVTRGQSAKIVTGVFFPGCNTQE